jgi:hypothetical protein
MAVPYDTSLTAPGTSRALGVTLPPVRDLLTQFRQERETRSLGPAFN